MRQGETLAATLALPSAALRTHLRVYVNGILIANPHYKPDGLAAKPLPVHGLGSFPGAKRCPQART